MPDDNDTPLTGDEPREDEAGDIVPDPVIPGLERTDAVDPIHELEELARQEIRRSVSPSSESSSIKSRNPVEQEQSIERIRTLQFVELTVSPDVPPEEAMREIADLYTGNLVSDEVFWYASQGERLEVLRRLHQGMLNRFQPTAEELALYPPGYESVQMQMYRDMLGGPDRPGEYRVFGLRDEQGVLRAWESFRIPSRDPQKMQLFKEYLQRTIFNPECVHLTDRIIPKLQKANYRLIEFDTANISPGWNMVGTLLLYRSLSQLREELKEDMPKGLFFYRFSGITPLCPKPIGDDDDFDIDLGENDSTARAMRRWGCGDIGYRLYSENDRIVRVNVPHAKGPISIVPSWVYSSGKVEDIDRMCSDYLERKGVI